MRKLMKRNTKGFTLVEIMIVVAIIALLAAIAIPNLLRARISSNEALVRSTLRAMSTAAETFATDNAGDYPTVIGDLTGATPPYLNVDYTDTGTSGYEYGTGLVMTTTAYTFMGTPTSTSGGDTTFTIIQGGVTSSTDPSGLW